MKIKYLISVTAILLSLNGFGQEFFTNLTYNMSVPLGSTKDFVGKTSFRGFSFELGRYITDEIAVDIRFSWHVFYEAYPFGEYDLSDGTSTIYGKPFKYINSFPMTVGIKYIFSSGGDFLPYAGAGLGAYKINERTDMGIYYVENKQWHFGIYPEVGMFYQFSYSLGLNVFARYEYAFKAGDTTSHSYINFGIGLHFLN